MVCQIFDPVWKSSPGKIRGCFSADISNVSSSLAAQSNDKWEKNIFNFIWGGKRDKIKRATLRSKYKAGGLQVPDISAQAQSLKMLWVKKYLDLQNFAKWKIVIREKLSFLGRNVNVFECSFSRVTIDRRISNSFWREVLSTWMKLKLEPETGEEVLKQVIWLNKNMDFKESQDILRHICIQKGKLK